MDLPKQGIFRTFRDKSHKEPREIVRTWNFLHLQCLVETNPIESQ